MIGPLPADLHLRAFRILAVTQGGVQGAGVAQPVQQLRIEHGDSVVTAGIDVRLRANSWSNCCSPLWKRRSTVSQLCSGARASCDSPPTVPGGPRPTPCWTAANDSGACSLHVRQQLPGEHHVRRNPRGELGQPRRPQRMRRQQGHVEHVHVHGVVVSRALGPAGRNRRPGGRGRPRCRPRRPPSPRPPPAERTAISSRFVEYRICRVSSSTCR